MSVPSDNKLPVPIEDKYSGQSTADLLADDADSPERDREEQIELTEPVEEPEKEEDILKEEKKEKKEKKEGEEEREDEEEKIELEEDEKDEKIDEPVFPSPRKVILAKYPNLFKDFPHLEKAMFRDKAFTELVGSVEDAHELVDAKQRLDNIQTDVFQGNIADLLTEVKKVDNEAFNRVVDNYLPALMKADQTAYLTVISNVGSAIVKDMFDTAKANNSEDLEKASIILHQYLFPGMQYQGPRRLAREEPKINETVQQQQQAFAEQQLGNAVNEVATRTTNTLRATVENYIDPKGQMTSYEKKGAIQDVLDSVFEQVGGDTYFKTFQDKLWKKASDTGFNRNDIEQLKRNFLARAKVILPATIGKIRQEVLKSNRTSKEDSNSRDKKGPIRPGRVASTSDKDTSRMSASEKAKLIPKGMTSEEYLNKD